MPALNQPRPHTQVLANGLRVTLRHAPDLNRCAAVLRVAAGSHDAPLEWPGLAHFLEHLLFLATDRFAAGEGLMAYVQRHGGQINARTSERTTDFFFEVLPQALSGGLQRLSDMLAHPRMDLADQLQELEVLHAEFVAWSQDESAQQRLHLFDGLSVTHPLRGFHAGNRQTLAVSEAAFQCALKDFHQRFYQTGQMTLSLVGPQSIEALQTLADQFSSGLAQGQTLSQAAPLPLLRSAPSSYQQGTAQRLDVLFAFEALPEASTQALDFLCHWLNVGKAGGLLAHLRDRGMAETMKATPLYEFDGQALLHIQFGASTAATPAALRAQLQDWLSFFAAQQDWAPLRNEFDALRQRQAQVSSALQRAQIDVQLRVQGLSDAGLNALQFILEHMGAVDNFTGPWHLPAPNPFLHTEALAPSAGLIRGQTSKHRGLRTFAQDRLRSRREHSAMQFSQALADHTDEGAVFLRWRLVAIPAQTLQASLERQMNPICEEAREAGVECSFSASGPEWLLKMTGLQAPMPSVLEHALKALTAPQAAAPLHARPSIGLIPIRQLLKALPELCQQQTAQSDDLAHLWSTAQWDGLATGMTAHTQAAMGLALRGIPGLAAEQRLQPPLSIASRHLWHHVDSGASEHALLLFCPTPTLDLADEAAWRLIVHLCQAPFYQRLRGELQLGYAVFSALRQIHGQAGIVFGVQSPHAIPSVQLQHIEAFINELANLINGLDEQTFTTQRQTLANQFDRCALVMSQAAELLWQAKLAGHSVDYLTQLPQAILTVERAALTAALQQLSRAEGGWRCVATSADPGLPWSLAH